MAATKPLSSPQPVQVRFASDPLPLEQMDQETAERVNEQINNELKVTISYLVNVDPTPWS